MKKVNYIFVLASVLIVTVLGIGASYSLWNTSVSQDKVNTAMTSCFDITYSSESNAINLEKQYPISDEAGSKLTPYTFKITNNCDINAYYKINLETLNTSNIDTRFIKASLNNTNPQDINMYNETEVSLKKGKVANTLKSGYLPVGGSISFDLRVWLDYDTTINDIKNDGTDKWVGKIVVISSPVTEDEINKVCQSNGGDLIDDGECRKYYAKLNNYIENINFKDNGANWSFHQSNFVDYKDDLLKIKCVNFPCGIYQYPLEKTKEYDKYYFAFTLKADDTKIDYFMGMESVHRFEGGNYPQWTDFSYEFTYDDDVKKLISSQPHGYIIYTFNAMNINEVEFYLKNMVYIDLTLMFGKDNEPNKKWCDRYLIKTIDYDPNGTLIPIKEIGEPIKTSYYDKIDMFD